MALSWVGTGRLIFSLDYSAEDFDIVCRRFVAAAQAMQVDGWWWHDSTTTNKTIRRNVLAEMLRHAARRARGVGHAVATLGSER